MAQLSHQNMITGKTITLTILTFVGKVLSLLFNTLFRFVFTFYYFIKGKNYQKKKVKVYFVPEFQFYNLSPTTYTGVATKRNIVLPRGLYLFQ